MRTILLSAAILAATFTASAQNLVKNGDFKTPLNTETVNKIPDSNEWFAFDKTNGKTTFTAVTDDAKHGNAVQIETTTDNSWYRAYLAQRIQGAEKGIYTLSFEIKALTPKTNVRFFLRDAKNDKLYFLREGFDINDESTKKQSAAAYSRSIKKLDKWTKVNTTFDFNKVADNISSPMGIEKKGGKINISDTPEDMLKDFVLVIQLQNKNTKALIDNISLIRK